MFDLTITLGNILTVLSLLFGVYQYLHEKRKQRIANTLVEIDHLFEMFDSLKKKKVNDNYDDFVSYIRRLDRLAYGTEKGSYELEVIKERFSRTLVSDYDRRLKDIVENRRKQMKRESYYKSLENLVEKMRAYLDKLDD